MKAYRFGLNWSKLKKLSNEFQLLVAYNSCLASDTKLYLNAPMLSFIVGYDSLAQRSSVRLSVISSL